MSSKMPWWTRARAERWDANDVLQHFEVRDGPVPIQRMLERMGIELYVATKPAGWSCVVQQTATRARIYVDDALAEPHRRQLWALALERLVRREHYPDDAESRWVSAEAMSTDFARELLMPSWLVLPYVDVAHGSRRLLVRAFRVTEPWLAERLRELYR